MAFPKTLLHQQAKPRYTTSILYNHFQKMFPDRNYCVGEEFNYYRENYPEEWDLYEKNCLHKIITNQSRTTFDPKKIAGKDISTFGYDIQDKGGDSVINVLDIETKEKTTDDVLPEVIQSWDQDMPMVNPAFEKKHAMKKYYKGLRDPILIRKQMNKCLTLREVYFKINLKLEASLNEDLRIEAGEEQTRESETRQELNQQENLASKENQPDSELQISNNTDLLIQQSDDQFEYLKNEVEIWDMMIEMEKEKQAGIRISGVEESLQDREARIKKYETDIEEFWSSIERGVSIEYDSARDKKKREKLEKKEAKVAARKEKFGKIFGKLGQR